LVYEVDESDGSLVSFRPDVGVVLNIGTDHYDRAKLLELFATYLGHCKSAGVILDELHAELALPSALPVHRFAPCVVDHRPPPPHGTYEADGADFVIRPTHYAASPDGISFSLALPSSDLTASQPHSLTPLPFTARQYGRHSATNAAAVVATLQAAGLPYNEGPWRKAVAAFRGVARRFDHVGTTRHGIAVFDDYAHNVEKVCAAIAAAQELSPPTPGLLVIFQPHGYGPFKFMREPLLEALRAQLRPHDTFAFLPVFYAGGTTSFSPKSEEVCAEYAAAGLHVRNFASKAEAEAFVAAGADSARTVLVLGARDPALPHWCATLAAL
jgi:UDP-N-acetylmuramate--alanine ligase